MNDRTTSPRSPSGSPRTAERTSPSKGALSWKGATAVLVAAGVLYAGGKNYIEGVQQEAINHDLAAQIVEAGPNVVQAVESGKLGPDFEVIKSPASGYIGFVAGAIGGGNTRGAVPNLQAALTAQSPAGVIARGEEIAIPVGFVDSDEQQRLLANHAVVFPKP